MAPDWNVPIMSAKKKDQNDSVAFEQSLERLEQIVHALETGETPLDQAIALFEEGKGLGQKCVKHLTEMEQRVLKIIDKENGPPAVKPFEAPADNGQ